MHKELTLSAGVAVEFSEDADFFRLLDDTQADVSVIFYKLGREVARAENIGEGYAERIAGGFDRVRLSSTAGGAIAFVCRLGGDVRYDKAPAGDVNVINFNGPFVNAAKTVTNASGQLLAANSARRYLMVQNNDGAGIIYVRLDGTAATVGTGFKIPAGGYYEVAGYVPSGAITAIGDIASNANVVVIEG